ncbi:hypothetical protein G6F38_012652 [Rhizopus arrhizus]|nr:hypothetical protein G6F38_012652 [Rhizopus arrhizus]
MQHFPPRSPLSPYTGDNEPSSRQAEQTGNSVVRMVTTEEMVSSDTAEMGCQQVEDRRLCRSPQCETEDILEPETRSNIKRNRCVPTNLAHEGTVSQPSLEIDTKSDQKTTVPSSQGSHTCNTTMADTILVDNDQSIASPQKTNNNENQQTMDVGRVDVIRKKRTEEGLPEEATQYLNQSIRKTTSKTYDYGWRIWKNWCKRHNHEPTRYDPKAALQFLVDHREFSTQYLNVLRSSIVSVHNIIHPNQPPLSQYPLIQNFFRAKRKTDTKIPKPHEDEIWNVQSLIELVKTWGPTSQLSISSLQQKTIILLGIATMWRPRSDLGRLQFRDVHFVHQGDHLTGVTLISRQPKESQYKTSKLDYGNERKTI